MKPNLSVLLVASFLLTAFAGCSSEDDVLAASFVATNLDAEKTKFKFDASSSTGNGLKYSWDFGDRSEPKSGEVIEHTYEYPNGAYQVTLTVTDSANVSKKTTQPVVTGNGQNEGALLYLTVDKRRAVPEEEILFDASQSMDPDGDPVFFEWDFNAEIDEQTLADMENLGFQAYGRFPADKPAPGGDGGNATGNETASNEGLTPSGHDWAQEVEKARQRLYDMLGWKTLHGGEPGAAEPRNTELDGKIPDTGPIQFYKYPSTAVYYVHVRVEDIKGAGQEGFIKISIEDASPATSNTTQLKGELKPAPLSPVQGAVPNPQAQTYSMWPFRYEFPGTTSLTLKYTNSGDQGDKLVAVYVCGTSSFTDCRNGSPKAKLAAGPSERNLAWDISPGDTFPSTYYVVVANEGNAIITFDFAVTTEFDTNPWSKDEAGFGGAHH